MLNIMASASELKTEDVVPVGSFSGRHIFGEFYGIGYEILNNEEFLCEVLRESIPKCGATVLGVQSHSFTPNGVTVLAILAESHASFHTYPERDALFFDIFTCGNCAPSLILSEIMIKLKPEKSSVVQHERGNKMSQVQNKNIIERIAPGINQHWTLKQVVFDGQSQYQDIVIGETDQGYSLFCNDERQSTEQSQKIYHEGQIYPAALMAKEINSVLIIGSSEGVISHLARDLGAEEIVHVDIDVECVELCAQFLPYGYTATEVKEYRNGKGKIQLVVQDGFSFVEECLNNNKLFDLIIMDLPDEQMDEGAQQNRLYDAEFLTTLSQLLTSEGAFITQAGCATYWRNESLKKAWARFGKIFKCRVMFEMEEQNWAWIVGTNFYCEQPVERMQKRLLELKRKPQFIDSQSIVKATIPPLSVRR